MLKKVKLSQLDANPYRHFKTYPISKEKVADLQESIEATGFWGETVIARPHGKRYQLAFGHHRIAAARKQLGERAEVQISIRKLSEQEMLTMMARENNDVYAVSADMDLEVVVSAIQGFIAGDIDLPEAKATASGKVSKNALTPEKLGFDQEVPGSPCTFTKAGLEKLLAMSGKRVGATIGILKAVQKDELLTVQMIQGKPTEAALALVRATRSIERNAGAESAVEASKIISTRMNRKTKAKKTREDYKQIANNVVEEFVPKKAPEKEDINKVSLKIGKKVKDFLDKSDLAKVLRAIVKDKEFLEAKHRKSLISQLGKLETAAADAKAELEADRVRLVK